MSILRPPFPHQLQQVGPREEVPRQSWPEPDVLAAQLEHARIHQPGRQSSGNRTSFLNHSSRFGSWLVRFPLSFYLFLPIFIFILPSRNKGNREFVAINRVQSSSFKKTNEYVKRHTLKTFHRERSSRRVERNEADR